MKTKVPICVLILVVAVCLVRTVKKEQDTRNTRLTGGMDTLVMEGIERRPEEEVDKFIKKETRGSWSSREYVEFPNEYNMEIGSTTCTTVMALDMRGSRFRVKINEN